MRYSEVGICNQALVLLRADKIASFEDTTVARACGTLYPEARDRLLEMADWSFARRYKELDQVIDNAFDRPEGFTLYAKPSDCLVPRTLVPKGAPKGHQSIEWEELGPYLMVSASVVSPCLYYTALVTEPGYFSAGFVHLLTLDIAARGALPIARDKVMASQYSQQFTYDSVEVIGRDANRGVQHPTSNNNPDNDSFVNPNGSTTST